MEARNIAYKAGFSLPHSAVGSMIQESARSSGAAVSLDGLVQDSGPVQESGSVQDKFARLRAEFDAVGGLELLNK